MLVNVNQYGTAILESYLSSAILGAKNVGQEQKLPKKGSQIAQKRKASNERDPREPKQRADRPNKKDCIVNWIEDNERRT